MSNTLARRPENAVAVNAPKTLAERVGRTPEMIELIRQTIANGAPDLELEYFIRFCTSRGLDPFARQAYYIPRLDHGQKKWTVQIGIDGYRSMAAESAEYDGQDDATFIYDEKDAIYSASVKVYRKGISRPTVGTARFTEYVVGNNNLWQKMPHVMLAKCAEALALRKAFPQKLGGIYTTEEMEQASVTNVTPLAVPKGATRRETMKKALAAQTQTLEQLTVPAAPQQRPDVDFTAMTAEQVAALVADEARAANVESADLRQIVKDAGGLRKTTAPLIIERLRAAKPPETIAPAADDDYEIATGTLFDDAELVD